MQRSDKPKNKIIRSVYCRWAQARLPPARRTGAGMRGDGMCARSSALKLQLGHPSGSWSVLDLAAMGAGRGTAVNSSFEKRQARPKSGTCDLFAQGKSNDLFLNLGFTHAL